MPSARSVPFLLSILIAQRYANFFNSTIFSRKKLKIFSNSLSPCVFCFRANWLSVVHKVRKTMNFCPPETNFQSEHKFLKSALLFNRATSWGTEIQCLIHSVNVCHSLRPVTDNVRAAWRRRGVRYCSCGTQTFMFPLHFPRRYTPACHSHQVKDLIF